MTQSDLKARKNRKMFFEYDFFRLEGLRGELIIDSSVNYLKDSPKMIMKDGIEIEAKVQKHRQYDAYVS